MRVANLGQGLKIPSPLEAASARVAPCGRGRIFQSQQNGWRRMYPQPVPPTCTTRSFLVSISY